MQELTLTGYVGNVDMRYLPDGTSVTNFSLACTDRWTDKNTGQKKEKTTWYRCAAWRGAAEIIAQYVQKGSWLLVKGVLNSDENGGPRVFERHDGTYGASYEVTVRSFEFGPRVNNEQAELPTQDEDNESPF